MDETLGRFQFIPGDPEKLRELSWQTSEKYRGEENALKAFLTKIGAKLSDKITAFRGGNLFKVDEKQVPQEQDLKILVNPDRMAVIPVIGENGEEMLVHYPGERKDGKPFSQNFYGYSIGVFM